MKEIQIIGGGLAGLFLGIRLRQNGVPVAVLEGGTYPRHRVCGEFISGRALEFLQPDLEALLLEAGARVAATAAFFHGRRSFGIRPLPSRALCLSRFVLDAVLAQSFKQLGGVLTARQRIPLPATPAPGVVLATGRRPGSVDRHGWRWFGLKAHAHGVHLEADLEMHLDQDAYVGLCRLHDGRVNVCGLFRRRKTGNDERNKEEDFDPLRGAPGTTLYERLKNAAWIEGSRCSVAGLALEPQAIDPTVCRVGDALTMIPPITGNGMSMAFESATLATSPLVAYAKGETGWNETTVQVADSLARAFGARLRWAQRLHALLFARVVPTSLLSAAFRHGWETGFRLTRA